MRLRNLGPQCSANDVNSAGVIIGNCLSSTNVRTAFVAVSPAAPVALAPLAVNSILLTPLPCNAGGLDNAPAATAKIVGRCEDANSVYQAVVWNASTPSATPLLLQPLTALLGIGAGVATRSGAINLQGVVVGVSDDNSGTATPVTWSAAGVATALPGGPLLQGGLVGPTKNCAAVDISDAATPAIVGNCSAAKGKKEAILWPTPTTNYIILPIPSGASYCTTSQINLSGQVMGACVYLGANASGADVSRTVRWASGGGSVPTVLMTLVGLDSPHNSGAGMNASGQIAGNYKGANGFTLPYYWAAGTDATPISALPEGQRAYAVGISDNATIIGCGEVAGGAKHAFHYIAGAVVEDVPLRGGGNSCANRISPDGHYIVGSSEDGGEKRHAVVLNP